MTGSDNNGNGNGNGSEEFNFGNPPPLGNAFFGQMFGIAPPAPQDPPMRNYRPNSLSQPFNLVERFKTGKPSLGYGLLLGSPYLARIIGAGGYDWVMIDWEHTPMSIREVTELIRWVQYASEGQTAAVVRVPNADHQWISWCLDAGASAIMLPHSETVEQARAMVAAAKFPSAGGKRSFPPAALAIGINDGVPHGKTPFDVWNNAAIIMQIESKLGCENAEAIAAIEGVDCLMVGNGDLRMDLGLAPGMDGPEDEYNKCLEQVIKAGKKYNRPCLTFTAGPGHVEKRLKQGFSAFMVGADAFAIGASMRATLQQSHDEIKGWQKGGGEVEEWQFNK